MSWRQYSSESERFRTVPNYSSQAASIKFRPVPNGSRLYLQQRTAVQDLWYMAYIIWFAACQHRELHVDMCGAAAIRMQHARFAKARTRFDCLPATFLMQKAKRWLQRARKHLTHDTGNWALWCSKAQFCKPGPSQCSTHSEIWECGKPYYTYYTRPSHKPRQVWKIPDQRRAQFLNSSGQLIWFINSSAAN